MPETVKKCPLCGHEHSRLFEKAVFKKQVVENRICQFCGLVYQSPRMTASEADAFYQAEYRRMYQGKESPISKDLSVQRARAASLVNFVQPTLPEINHHLDIGASAGILLQAFQATYQTTPLGIEPGDAYRNYAQRQGLILHPSLDALRETTAQKFDLVSMAHVLEHLPDPVGYLTDLRENLLSPDGWLLIEVPNLYAHNSFEVAHLLAFSSHTLRQTLQKAGFEIMAIETHGRPISELFPLYLTVLAKPGQIVDSIEPENNVIIKRRWGLLKREFLARLSPHRAWISI